MQDRDEDGRQRDVGADELYNSSLSAGIWLMSRDLYQAMNRAIDARVARFGLASHACRYLAIIRDRDGATPKELSALLGVRSPTTLAALRTLEEKRLIKKTRDEDDGRKSLYRLTREGAKIEALVRESAMEVERLATESLTPGQIESLGAMVDGIRRSLKSGHPV